MSSGQQIFFPPFDLDDGEDLRRVHLKGLTATERDELPYKPPASHKLRLNKLQHEAIALIANLDHAEIPRVVGPAEHLPFFG